MGLLVEGLLEVLWRQLLAKELPVEGLVEVLWRRWLWDLVQG